MNSTKYPNKMQEEVIDIEENDLNINTNSNTTTITSSSASSTPSSSTNKRKAKKDDSRKPVKVIKKENGKRIPNIAEELAKNRNQAKGTSPSPVSILSSSPNLPQQSLSPNIDGKMTNSKATTDKNEKPYRQDVSIKTEQIKISSLLSPNEEMDAPTKISDHTLPLDVGDSSRPQSQQATGCPKVILPTQKPGGSALESPESADNANILVARMSSPINLPEKLTSSLKKSHSVVGTSTSISTTSSKVIGATQQGSNGSKGTAEKAKKSSSTSSLHSKGKVANKNNGDSKKKTNTKTVKKEQSVPPKTSSTLTSKGSNAANDKKENTKKASAKSNTAKKDNATATNKSADTKKKSNIKKESIPPAKPKTPKKLVTAPPIKSPSLLEVFERGKTAKEDNEPVVIIDVPLYPAKSNEYLDENGQVVFNYYKLVHDKIASQSSMSLSEEKIAKRNLLGQLSNGNPQTESIEDNEEGDMVDDEEDVEEEDEEEADEEKASMSPKKRPHPNKGKSLIGKYDIEDPFIDDSELLWEEQRAATKDGFFVYFGPLIEKGHYASLERADGTMKRGGVKNK